MCMCHIVICGLPQSTKFFPQRTMFKKKVIEHNMCVLIFSTTSVWNISHSKKNCTRYDQKCMLVFIYRTRYFNLILIKLEFSWQIFKRYSNTKFHKNPFSESRVIYSVQTDGWTDMMKLTVNFRNFANTPTNLFSSNVASFIDNLIKVFHVPYTHSSKLDIMLLPHPSYDELTLLLSVA
jgi:hypothetical protein